MFEIVYQKNFDTPTTAVSFFTDAEYYANAARQMAAKLDQMGVSYILYRLNEPPAEWHEITKRKIDLYAHVAATQNTPFVFLDVDTEIVSDIRPLFESMADLSGFLRDFKYIGTMNTGHYSRLLHPGYLRFSNTPSCRKFIDFLHHISDSTTAAVTDDYVLHQAVRTFREPLSIHFYPPKWVAKQHNLATEHTIIIHGDSDNVSANRSKVVQHFAQNKALKEKTMEEVINYLHKNIPEEHAYFAYKYSAAHGTMNRKSYVRYLRLLRKLKKTDELAEIVAQNVTVKNRQLPTVEFQLEYLLKFVGRKEAEAYLASINGVVDDLVFRMGESILFKYKYANYKPKSILGGGKPDLTMWWWDKPYPGNLGDILNPYLVSRITGRGIRYTTGGPRIIAIGSILKFADKETIVWGSGLSRLDSDVCPEARYLAVRGPLTRDVVIASGGTCPEVYGDPALLLPSYYKPKALNKPKTHKVGLILHHNHHGFEPKMPAEGWKNINIIARNEEEIEAFLEELCSCESIVSTSLHGIIIAHAYGIPAVWCDMVDAGNTIPGDGLKYYDYYLSIGVKEPKCYLFSPEMEFKLPDQFDSRKQDFLPQHLPDLKKLEEALVSQAKKL